MIFFFSNPILLLIFLLMMGLFYLEFHSFKCF